MKYVTQTTMRNHCFRRAYEQARRERRRECVSKLVDRVLASPTKRGFFVGIDHVLVMERRRREGKLPRMGAMRQQMWDEIFAAIDARLAEHPESTLTDAVCHVLSKATASRFYISRQVAVRLAVKYSTFAGKS